MSEWIEYKLKDFAQLRKEQMIPNGEQFLYIGLEHIEQQSLRLAGIGSSDDVTSNKYRFHPYDTLYGKLRPYFRKVYHPKFEGICSTDILVIKNKDIVDPTYLFYLIASERFTQLANQSSTGTRMPRASWKHLSQTEWNIPPISTQRQIGRHPLLPNVARRIAKPLVQQHTNYGQSILESTL